MTSRSHFVSPVHSKVRRGFPFKSSGNCNSAYLETRLEPFSASKRTKDVLSRDSTTMSEATQILAQSGTARNTIRICRIGSGQQLKGDSFNGRSADVGLWPHEGRQMVYGTSDKRPRRILLIDGGRYYEPLSLTIAIFKKGNASAGTPPPYHLYAA